MVERYVPGVDSAGFAEAALRAASAAAAMTEQGRPVRYLGSVYVPEEECSFCCFEAHDAEAVREANRRAGVPFWRVVDAAFIEQAGDTTHRVEGRRAMIDPPRTPRRQTRT